eukprot:1147047-Pelagomonas_calceolata.AAC.1
MGMGKSAADALPELRRAGVTASGNSFVMGGQLMSAPEIASVLRLQVRWRACTARSEASMPQMLWSVQHENDMRLRGTGVNAAYEIAWYWGRCSI